MGDYYNEMVLWVVDNTVEGHSMELLIISLLSMLGPDHMSECPNIRISELLEDNIIHEDTAIT